MRLSRNRNWGNPRLLNFIEHFARDARALDGWPGLLVGDMSQPRGGPMITGHSSHQIGLDVDIWLTPMPDRILSTHGCGQELANWYAMLRKAAIELTKPAPPEALQSPAKSTLQMTDLPRECGTVLTSGGFEPPANAEALPSALLKALGSKESGPPPPTLDSTARQAMMGDGSSRHERMVPALHSQTSLGFTSPAARDAAQQRRCALHLGPNTQE